MKTLYFIFPFFVFCSSAVEQESTVNETLFQEIKVLDESNHNKYAWKANCQIENKLINRIPLPKGYKRKIVAKNSFGDWLRNLPLKTGKPDVTLYNGNLKGNQTAHFAVLDIDVGKKDLQQCADAVMRLRAEYLFSNQQKENIAFNFTSGDKCSYSDWRNGVRPKISGNKVSFLKTQNEDFSYKNFKKYMQTIFMYCGTFSLEKELKKAELKEIKAGDVFIKGGFPGHAVIVVDVAINTENNDIIFLLAQSYMPAQDIHLLKNNMEDGLNPWFSINFGATLYTPEWNFDKNSLRKF